MNNEKPNYRCAQKDFYTVAKMGWAHYATYHAQLASYKAFYKPSFGTNALAAVNAAQALADDQARGAISETERIVLVGLGRTCLDYFDFLKGYIESAYADDTMWKSQFEALGNNYYAKAAHEDWESMVSMNVSAVNYVNITENFEKLTANENMPEDFKEIIGEAADAFASKYADFLASSDTSNATKAKIVANNACYKTLTSMFRDAQRVFKYDPAILQKFTFSSLLASINPPVAGIRGVVKESETNVPLVVNIKTQKTGEVAVVFVSGADGTFSQQLAEGTYVIEVSAAGYVTQTMSLDLKLTGLKRLDVVMVKS